jgi:hypothetical protein
MRVVASDRIKIAKTRVKVAAINIFNALENKRRRHLRSGVRPLAKGVANTKAQNAIFNKMYFVLFGRLRNAYTMWKETIDHYREIGEAKRGRILERLVMASLGKNGMAFWIWKGMVDDAKLQDQRMKHVIGIFLKNAGLINYNYFVRWKLTTHTDLATRRTILRNRKLMTAGEAL